MGLFDRHLSGKPAILTLVIMMGVGPFGDTEYTPSLARIAHAFGVHYSVAQLSMTAYLLGFAICQLLYGPLSDRFGRRPLMLFGSVVFIIGSLICFFSNQIDALIWGRFVQSIGACAGSVIANAAVRDSFTDTKERTKVYAMVNAAFALAPALGPIVGSFVDHLAGWRPNFVILAALGAIQLTTVWFCFPETNSHIGEQALHPGAIAKSYFSCFKDRHFLFYLSLMGMAIGTVYCSLLGAPDIIVNTLHLGSIYIVVVAVSVLLGFVIGSALSAILTRFIQAKSVILTGITLMFLGSVAIAILAYIGYVSESLIGTVVPVMIIFMGIAIIYPISNARALAPFEHISGVAAAMMGFVVMGLASLCTGVMSLMHTTSVISMPILFIGCSVLAYLLYIGGILMRPRKV